MCESKKMGRINKEGNNTDYVFSGLTFQKSTNYVVNVQFIRFSHTVGYSRLIFFSLMHPSRPDDRCIHGFLNVFCRRRQLPSPYLKMAAIDRTDPSLPSVTSSTCVTTTTTNVKSPTNSVWFNLQFKEQIYLL